MRSDGTRDSDKKDGMAGPVICCTLETYTPLTFDRFRWPQSGKVKQVAVVRPVMKTDSISLTSSSAATSTAAAAADLSSQSIVTSASVGSSTSLQSNSRNTSGNSVSSRLSVVGNFSSSASTVSPSSSSSSSTLSLVSSSSAQSTNGEPPIGWEFTWSFYYPNLTMSEAKQLLKPHPEGTFLLRNSSEPRYAYSLSVKTNRGTTSVRIQRMVSGRYRLDCDPTQETVIPTFRSVPELIRHYLERNQEERNGTGYSGGHRYVFLESTGRMDTPVLILRPLFKDGSLERRNVTS